MNRTIPGLLVATLCGAAGCGWWGGDDDQAMPLDPPPADSVVDDDAGRSSAPAARLELRLEVGDRFPLLKTVAQELVQSSWPTRPASVENSQPGGTPAVSRSQVDLLLALTVEEIDGDRKRLGVQYHRVRYWQDVAGETIEYDSGAPHGPVPPEALPYSGLLDNGFSFWIGPDNQILEPVGFHAFLERCVRHVPPEERQEALARFAQASADEGIANFVDDSIGLLPYGDGRSGGTSVRPGTSWTRERRLQHPMPLVLATRYTLRDLNERTAEIDVLGNIGPATTWSPSPVRPVSGQVEVKVRSGHSQGTCTIDRRTGLPLQSRVERRLEMVVQTPDGSEFEQHKTVVTTVRAFPQQ